MNTHYQAGEMMRPCSTVSGFTMQSYFRNSNAGNVADIEITWSLCTHGFRACSNIQMYVCQFTFL